MKEVILNVGVYKDTVVLRGTGCEVQLTPDQAFRASALIDIAAAAAKAFAPLRITDRELCDLCSEKSPEEIVKLAGADKELFVAVVKHNVELGEYGYARELLDAWEVA